LVASQIKVTEQKKETEELKRQLPLKNSIASVSSTSSLVCSQPSGQKLNVPNTLGGRKRHCSYQLAGPIEQTRHYMEVASSAGLQSVTST
jgi:hypothetical protein